MVDRNSGGGSGGGANSGGTSGIDDDELMGDESDSDFPDHAGWDAMDGLGEATPL